MRFRVDLKPLENKIPLGNRIICLSIIKSAIKTENENLYKEIFFYEGKKNKKIKPFSFSIYLRDFKVNKDEIDINDNITITISTIDNKVGLTIFNGLLKMKNKNHGILSYKNNNFRINNIALLEEKKIKDSVITCKTLSPIHIKDKFGKSVDIREHEKFENELNYISNLLLKTYRGYGLKRKLKFSPICMKKQVIKEEIEGFKSKTNKRYIFIEAFSGVFELEGDIEDLNFLIKGSLGFRRSEGFGLIDLE